MQTSSRQALDWIVGVPRSGVANILAVLLFFTIAIVAWEFLARGNEFLYSRPQLIAGYFAANYASLARDVWVSAQHVLISLVVGSAVGFPLGVALALMRSYDKASSMVLGFLFAYPKLAVALMSVIWIGHVEISIYVTNIWVAFLINLLFGFRAARDVLEGRDSMTKDMAHAAALYYRSRGELLRRHVLPLVRSDWFSALMLSSGVLWPLLIFSEPMVSTSKPGLGTLLYESAELDIRMEAFFAAATLIAVCNLLTWATIRGFERYTSR